MTSRAKRGRDGERKVLDYFDVLLREADVELLEGPHWLNDQIVSFFFEYMEREGLAGILHEAAAGGPPSSGRPLAGDGGVPGPVPGSSIGPGFGLGPDPGTCDILLLPPATSFLLMHSSPQMAAELLAPLKPARRGLVLLPVNDNPHVDAAGGGSHWSLLVFHRPSNTLRHYDSSPGGGNARAARALAAAVGPALAACGSGDGGGGASAAAAVKAAPPGLMEVGCMPCQANGYDCGVYVLAVARAVCGWWLEDCGSRRGAQAAGGDPEAAAQDAGAKRRKGEPEARWAAQEADLRQWMTPGYIAGMREHVLGLIRSKAAAMGGRAGAGGGGDTYTAGGVG
ncbi:hypothetical protein GPECTOR_3g74 [Gonium pectorale]|uniref:Ubiquitin-like protease family profile domain-containing protein n=1 Tax=Gonium pectorale TaxID=33097 RepID=A0A150H0A0_GONPE|nr:hypothetical protein GPECTOR_3g74 [Gonium pectorale]|eukprot:KXZ55423.1 hypothetical protein GPECTOR_3g74 [Gonium pectorale]